MTGTSLRYISSKGYSDGDGVALDNSMGGATGYDRPADQLIWSNSALPLRSHSWLYTAGVDTVTGLSLDTARELDITVDFLSLDQWDHARRVFDSDLRGLRNSENAKTGFLEFSYPDPQGSEGDPDYANWTCNAVMVKSDHQQIGYGHVRSKLTFLLLGWWRHVRKAILFAHDVTTGDMLDLPTDMPFDLMPRKAEIVHNPMSSPMPFIMEFYGPAVNPAVNFGGNFYQVMITIADGERVRINSVDGERSVTHIAYDGTETDIFDKAQRGLGQGSGNYIFEPIPPGDTTLTWWGDYDLTISIVEEDSEPPWST